MSPLKLNPGDNVILQTHAQFRGPLLETARRLKADFGVKVHLYVANADQAAHYGRLGGAAFDSIVDTNILYAAARGPTPPADEVTALARKDEALLGVTFNELALGDRHLGRGYALGAYYHPRSRMSEETDYNGLLWGFHRQTEFWLQEFAEKRPVLVLNATKIPSLIARSRGIPLRLLIGARFANRFYWGHDEFYESPEIEAAYKAAPEGDPVTIEQSYLAYMRARKDIQRKATLSGTIYTAARILLTRLYWRWKGYEKAKGYFLGDELAYVFRQWRDMRRTLAISRTSLTDLAGKRFVFFPLHMEPEVALQGMSPEYFCQLSAIASLARDLPAGVLLAVKEHYFSIGRRPANWLEQMAEFKNVVMLRLDEYGPEVVKQAAAVATITSTAGFEAAVMGKPVVTFGRRNIYNFLPHVAVIRSEEELRPALATALSADFDAATARNNGARFMAAMEAISFTLGEFDHVKSDDIDTKLASAGYRRLLNSLGIVEHEAAA